MFFGHGMDVNSLPQIKLPGNTSTIRRRQAQSLTHSMNLRTIIVQAVANAFCDRWIYEEWTPLYSSYDIGKQFTENKFQAVCHTLRIRILLQQSNIRMRSVRPSENKRTIRFALRAYIASDLDDLDRFATLSNM